MDINTVSLALGLVSLIATILGCLASWIFFKHSTELDRSAGESLKVLSAKAELLATQQQAMIDKMVDKILESALKRIDTAQQFNSDTTQQFKALRDHIDQVEVRILEKTSASLQRLPPKDAVKIQESIRHEMASLGSKLTEAQKQTLALFLPESKVLSFIRDSDKPVDKSAIVRHFAAREGDAPDILRMLSSLEYKGLVIRRTDPSGDVRYSIAEEGEDSHGKIR